ncbi:MAG TPA: TetR/AcrR family transcriptional regulator [Rhodopila sp.]|jgi:TetR/AcrR family transcriptional repressor of nem operon
MKVSREQAIENRERIVQVAAALFRERGFDGIGVADLMKGAGLTHGGFYGHFASKEDLATEACRRALDTSLQKWSAEIEKAPGEAFSKIVNNYLSEAHRDDPGNGCLVAALGSDLGRQARPVRRLVTEGVHAFVGQLMRLVPGKSKSARRRKALCDFAAMVGAMTIARAVDDPGLSKDVLVAVASLLSDPSKERGP